MPVSKNLFNERRRSAIVVNYADREGAARNGLFHAVRQLVEVRSRPYYQQSFQVAALLQDVGDGVVFLL